MATGTRSRGWAAGCFSARSGSWRWQASSRSTHSLTGVPPGSSRRVRSRERKAPRPDNHQARVVTGKLARGSGAAAQHHRYFVDGVEVPGGDTDHEVVGSVVGHGEPASVQPVEGDYGRQCEPLV